ncbi:armadillo-type protein [Syncephalis plumigaleata]|nr:armadillo-type protein [Syncephalis plumigaleata]
MAKHSNRRGRRGQKKKDEEKRAENRELEARYEPEQREKRRLEIFVDTAGQPESAVETTTPTYNEEEEKEEVVPATKEPTKITAPTVQTRVIPTRRGNEASRETAPQVNFGLISEALQEYLNGVHDVIDSEQLQSDEERQVFLQNVYNEVAGHELKLLGDPNCSVTLEKLFIMSNASQILALLHIIQERLIDVVSHRFASHGCQTLLKQAALMVDKELRQDESMMDSPSDMMTCLLEIQQQLTPHVVPLMMDVFGSHIIRSLLFIFTGKPMEDEATTQTSNKGGIRSKRSAQFSTHHIKEGTKHTSMDILKVPHQFIDANNKLVMQIINGLNVAKLRDLSFDAMANPVFQLLLELEKSKHIQLDSSSFLDRFLLGLDQDEQSEHYRDSIRYLSALARDRVGSHLLERFIASASPQVFTRLFNGIFRGKLRELCQDPVANFVVQRLMPACNGPQQLELVLAEIVPLFPDLYKTRPGVLRSAVDACNKLNCGYKGVVKGLKDAVKMQSRDDDPLFGSVYIRLQTLEEYKSYAISRFHVQGSLILQSLLRFPEERNRIVINSLLGLNKQELMKWSCNAISSRVLESFFTVDAVSVKTKRKLAEQWTGSFHQLALDRYGGHVLDRYWIVADLAHKETIAQELLAHEQTLYASMHGKFILRNCRIDQFKRRREQWRQQQQGQSKKQMLFADIIQSSSGKENKPMSTSFTMATPNTTITTKEVSLDTSKKDKRKRSLNDDDDDATINDEHKESTSNAIEKKKKKKKKEDKKADQDLSMVLDAIKATTKTTSKKSKKSKSSSKA